MVTKRSVSFLNYTNHFFCNSLIFSLLHQPQILPVISGILRLQQTCHVVHASVSKQNTCALYSAHHSAQPSSAGEEAACVQGDCPGNETCALRAQGT